MLLSVGIGFAADYLFNLTLSKALSPHEYGDYKVAYAFAAIAGVLVLLGGDRVAPRILSGPLSRGDNRPVWSFFKFYLLIAALLSALVILVTTTASILHLRSMEIDQHHPLMLMSWVIPLIAIAALLSRILQSARMMVLSNLPWRIGLPLIKTAMVFMLSIVVLKVRLWQVIATGSAAACLIILWQWYHIRRRNLLSFESAPDQFEKRQVLRLSMPMMLAMLITLALNHLDLFMLELLGDEKEVGYLAAAATTAHILPVAQVTIAALFLPRIGAAMEQGAQAAGALFRQGQKLIAFAVVTLTLVLIIAGNRLLALFGADFRQAQPALIYLTSGYALWALAAFSTTWLQYSQKGNWVVLIGCLTLAINAGCNLWLIPLYGMNGAAVATLLAMAVTAAMIWLVYLRHLRAGVGPEAPAT